MQALLRVELHHANPTPFDLTPYVKSVSWSEAVSAPWDWCSLELSAPLSELLTNERRFSSEELPDESAAQDGTSRTIIQERQRLGIACDPGLWVKVIEAASGRVLSVGRISESKGSLFSGSTGTISSELSLQAIGVLPFLRTLATEFVPTLRQSVGGLMNAEAWRHYLELVKRLIHRADFGLVFGAEGLLSKLAPLSLPPTLIPGISTLGEFFSPAYTDETGAAVAPLRMMDEVPVAGATAIAASVPHGTVADLILGIFQREPRLIECFPSWEAPTTNPLEPGYADALPVMVHRLAPWRTTGLSQMPVDLEGGAVALALDARFEKATWDLSRALTLRRDELFRFSHQRTEQARVNALTVNWTVAGGQPQRLLPMAGLPLADRQDVMRHGARLLELNWDMAPDQRGDFELAKRLRTIGLLGWHFYGLGHVFRVGSIECPYLGLRARAGEPIVLDIGRPTPFTAYLTRVTHTVQAQSGGAVSTRSSLEFDRGLFDERHRSPHYQLRPKVTPAPLHAQPQKESPPLICAEGNATTFPRTFTLDITKVPDWLVSWAVSRGFRRGDFERDSVRANLLITAGVAYVIECYWRQVDADARMDVLSVLRATDESPNHRVGAALDFAIVSSAPSLSGGAARTLGALQTWAGLYRLSAAGRLPEGGCGLYLNLGPGGMTGTTADRAGQPSRPRRKTGPPSRRYPAGGSAGVHYDYRGALGFLPQAPAVAWVAADLDGDGRDEHRLTRDDRTILTEVLPQHAPAILTYFHRKGAADTSLPSVGPTVPNLMQALGQVASCFSRGPQ